MNTLDLSANYDSEVDKKRERRSSPIWKASKREVSTRNDIGRPEYTREYESLYDRHKRLVDHYASSSVWDGFTKKSVTDMDVIQSHHRFIWKESEEGEESLPWELALAKKYWDRLFKEYAICDLSRYLKNEIAMRWRTQKEVVQGKGQFSCASRKCTEGDGLRSWEVNFAYEEKKESKNALVKVRLCPDCSYKLNYCHKKKEVTKSRKHKRSHKSRRRSRKEESSPDSESTSEAKKSKGNEKKEEDTGKGDVWKEAPDIEKEKSREDNFSEYLEDLFM
uniref:Protein FRA10AC1like [Saccoglossus kowalevskii] n=1 Tax=Lepeophtheirus salmonis TaxID=72036 RepID=A0A0K2UHE6_LEPSM